MLPAFPCKSSNTTSKVLGSLPDAGEELALKNLHALCERISKFHSGGVELLIVSDGRVFADLVNVPDKVVTEYGAELRRMSASPFIHFLSLDDIFARLTKQQSREILVSRYGRSLEELHLEVLNSSDLNRLYCGLARFVKEDGLVSEASSGKAYKRECKFLALKMLQRSEAYSRLIAEMFPEHIRLSIHPHPNSTEKLGINLIGSGDGWGTPWHNVLVRFKDGEVKLMHKKDAERAGYRLTHREGRPYGYEE